MTKSTQPAASDTKIVRKYNQVYKSLTELIKAIQDSEPAGVLAEDVAVRSTNTGRIQVAYVATPIQLTITTTDRTFILKVAANKHDGEHSLTVKPKS